MDGLSFPAFRFCVVASPMRRLGSLMDRATIGSAEMMLTHAPVTILNLAIGRYIASLRRAFPAQPWQAVKDIAERAWFAADMAEIPWSQVESRAEAAWSGLQVTERLVSAARDVERATKGHRYVVVSAPPQAAPTNARQKAAAALVEYENWSPARRALQDDVKAGRGTTQDPGSDYGMHG